MFLNGSKEIFRVKSLRTLVGLGNRWIYCRRWRRWQRFWEGVVKIALMEKWNFYKQLGIATIDIMFRAATTKGTRQHIFRHLIFIKTYIIMVVYAYIIRVAYALTLWRQWYYGVKEKENKTFRGLTEMRRSIVEYAYKILLYKHIHIEELHKLQSLPKNVPPKRGEKYTLPMSTRRICIVV